MRQSNSNHVIATNNIHNQTILSDFDFQELLQFEAVEQNLFAATIAYIGNSTVYLFQFDTSWILDSVASNHIVCNIYLLSHLSSLETPYQITFANGSRAQAMGIDQAKHIPSLSLNFVLHIHGYPFNLISIS